MRCICSSVLSVQLTSKEKTLKQQKKNKEQNTKQNEQQPKKPQHNDD